MSASCHLFFCCCVLSLLFLVCYTTCSSSFFFVGLCSFTGLARAFCCFFFFGLILFVRFGFHSPWPMSNYHHGRYSAVGFNIYESLLNRRKTEVYRLSYKSSLYVFVCVIFFVPHNAMTVGLVFHPQPGNCRFLVILTSILPFILRSDVAIIVNGWPFVCLKSEF